LFIVNCHGIVHVNFANLKKKNEKKKIKKDGVDEWWLGVLGG